MPFDGTTKTELEILDAMAVTLATPDKWCQGMFEFGSRHCLAAALMLADGGRALFGEKLRSPVAKRVLAEMDKEMGDVWPVTFSEWGAVCAFNNSHTHCEVLDLIARTRRVFERENADAV